ncbi:hypothetical protein HPB47_007128 [Ixodes persulcatus]|uniref:Uncharacterized protein n=1 Tax=Ixodes persulcatus TaxID=34615 RepID=A0AC60P9A9_IXOPE|nr:hypothetical protein HPB47_007128 [Ixodes persulcatus]
MAAEFVDAPRSGRPRDQDEEEDRMIVVAAVRDPLMIAKEMRQELSLSLSTKSTRRRQVEAGMKKCIAAQNHYLADAQCRAGLSFARALEH